MNRKQDRIWNATLYLRSSHRDEGSNSLAGQRELLQAFLDRHPEIHAYTVQSDDGLSGLSFERPGFQAMMADVKSGKCNCIIVKDLSRFGRNYLDAGEYIENLFPLLGIRFIAVTDGYDSLEATQSFTDVLLPIKNLINEAYSHDISIKIRSQLETKRQNGEFIGSFTPYGYKRCPQDRHCIVIDVEAATVVRDIFNWKIEGLSPGDIAKRLNARGVLSPAEYKKAAGCKYTTPFQIHKKATWSAASIIRLLKNSTYIGVLEQGKMTAPDFKKRTSVVKPVEQWAVVADHHEPLISRMEFDATQKILASDTRRAPNKESVYAFSGMIICGECGGSMVRKVVPSNGKRYVYYVCATHKQNRSCFPHGIRDINLEDIVLASLRAYIQQIVAFDELIETVDENTLKTVKAKKVEAQIDLEIKQLEWANRLLSSLSGSLDEELIAPSEFRHMKDKYSAQVERLRHQIKRLQKDKEHVLTNAYQKDTWILEFLKNVYLTELERSVVVTLIEHITVYKDKTVKIQYRFQDEYEWMREALLADSACQVETHMIK